MSPPKVACHSIPRCNVVAAETDAEANLTDEQIAAIFKEFDTSGDGFIDLGELRAALAKAGKPVSDERAAEILSEVDENEDGQISLEEFKAVFKLTTVPEALRPLFDAKKLFLDSLDRVGSALGIEIRGQWRSTVSGSRYVDDVLGVGKLVLPGDVVQIHYTVTLVNTGTVVETSRRGGPLNFKLGEPDGKEQGWSDAVQGMRVGGQRRVYATPSEGDGPSARYDIEIVGLAEDVTPASTQEKLITALGGRRAAARLLFALTFVPYFLPDEYQPKFFKAGWGEPETNSMMEGESSKPVVDRADAYVSKQLDDLFSNEVLPSSRSGKAK